jgi:hypothetical protein
MGGGAVCTEMRYYDISLETCEANCNTKLGCKGISYDKEAKRCLLKDVATCGETTPPGVGGFGFVDGGGSVFYGRSVSSRHSPRDKLSAVRFALWANLLERVCSFSPPLSPFSPPVKPKTKGWCWKALASHAV